MRKIIHYSTIIIDISFPFLFLVRVSYSIFINVAFVSNQTAQQHRDAIYKVYALISRH